MRDPHDDVDADGVEQSLGKKHRRRKHRRDYNHGKSGWVAGNPRYSGKAGWGGNDDRPDRSRYPRLSFEEDQ